MHAPADVLIGTPSPKLESTTEAIKTAIHNHLSYTLAHSPEMATKRDWWVAVCMAVRDRVLQKSLRTMRHHREVNTRRVHYLSLEYLMGRLLENNLRNSGLYDVTKAALAELGSDLDELLDEESDMGLGNGGLGRLAACFLDSMATLDLPSVGYGIHYEFGLFRQKFDDQGRQIERPDAWIGGGNPWKIVRPEYEVTVRLYGRVEQQFDDNGNPTPVWVDTREIIGQPSDIPIVGYDSFTVNFLRLWKSCASNEFDFDVFNRGGYVEAVREKVLGETVSKVLYPNDATESGRELRLVQQYFFVACSLRDIIRRHQRDQRNSWDNFADKVAIQLNDTHPAVAVVELMRILVDEEGLEWERAWEICQQTFSYTNHTLLPEALERWSVPLFEKVLPRHLQLIFEINQRFLDQIAAIHPDDPGKLQQLSIIEEGDPKMVRMAFLSVIASHSTNGVAALHTKLLTERLFPEFHKLYPERFNNKTNGITPRRWLKCCNPELSELIDRTIGDGWPKDLDRLQQLASHAVDPEFQREFLAIKLRNKERLAGIIRERCGVGVDPSAMFDVQIKRLHEYKRQHLNLLHILTLYRQLLNDPDSAAITTPRVFIFAAKAAPGYYLAKTIIHAINAVAHRINHDDRINGLLKVAFIPNYGVTMAERIIPAADLSEQISTAGKEASGTGNMKLALNGALTIGTLDGANVEIREEVGDDNIFIFGLTVDDVDDLREQGYNPWDIYWQDEELRTSLDWLTSGYFTGNAGDFQPIRDSLLDGGDPFLVLADYRAYVKAQRQAAKAFQNPRHWARMAILNTASVGKFSSDRTIRQYAEEIWNLQPVRPNDGD